MMSDSMAFNRTVYVAMQHIFLVGVFITEDAAKKACQAHYDSYAALKPILPAGTLEWGQFVDLQGAPCLQTPHMGGQAVYRINSIPLDVNLQMRTQINR